MTTLRCGSSLSLDMPGLLFWEDFATPSCPVPADSDKTLLRDSKPQSGHFLPNFSGLTGFSAVVVILRRRIVLNRELQTLGKTA